MVSFITKPGLTLVANTLIVKFRVKIITLFLLAYFQATKIFQLQLVKILCSIWSLKRLTLPFNYANSGSERCRKRLKIAIMCFLSRLPILHNFKIDSFERLERIKKIWAETLKKEGIFFFRCEISASKKIRCQIFFRTG